MPSPIDLGPKPILAYADSPLDRAAEKRGDDSVLASLRQAPTCLHYVVGGDWVVLKKTSNGYDPAFSFSEVSALAIAFQCQQFPTAAILHAFIHLVPEFREVADCGSQCKKDHAPHQNPADWLQFRVPRTRQQDRNGYHLAEHLSFAKVIRLDRVPFRRGDTSQTRRSAISV